MKHLIKIQQPNDYHFNGRTVYINPDDIVSLKGGERYSTIVWLRNGESYATDTNKDTIAQQIQEAL